MKGYSVTDVLVELLKFLFTGPIAAFTIPFILIFILCVIYCAIIETKKKNDKDGSYRPPNFNGIPIGGLLDSSYNSNAVYDKIDSISMKYDNCSTPESAQDYVDQLYSVQLDLEVDGASAHKKTYLSARIREGEEKVRKLEKDRWERKAEEILSSFKDDFSYVTAEYEHDFRNVDDVLKASQRCIRSWHKYWSLLDQFEINENLYEYLKKFLGESFDPCMHSSEALKRRMDTATEKLKPEHRRKKQIYDDIVQYVMKHDNIMRCELLKHRFKNATDKEVRYCYNDLIKKYRLVETKIGSRYFVSLSDKEKKKHSHG